MVQPAQQVIATVIVSNLGIGFIVKLYDFVIGEGDLGLNIAAFRRLFRLCSCRLRDR